MFLRGKPLTKTLTHSPVSQVFLGVRRCRCLRWLVARINYPRFVYYFFKSVAPQIARMDVGDANLTLNRNHVHPMPIVWPPLAEQKAIAAVLGPLDDKIELNRRMNATLEAMARALLQSWFVDFDPIRAKLDGRPPRRPLPRALGRLTARQKAHRLGSHRVGERAGSIGNRRAAQGWSRRNHERRSKHRRGVR